MPAQSQQQQKLFGLALAVKRGEVSPSEVSDKVRDIVDRMSEKEIEDFASTSHKGLPKKVEQQIREMVREIMRERAIAEMSEEPIEEAASRTAMEIGGLTGMNKDAIQKFVDDNNLDIEKVFQYVKKGKLKDRMELVSAIAGKPNNPVQKKMIKMFGEAKIKMNNLDWGKSTAERNANLDKYDSLKTDKEKEAFLRKLKGESINEAVNVSGKADAQKVKKAYEGFFKVHPALGRNAMGVPAIHHLGAIKELYKLAMIDANFGREGDATANQIKGRLFPVEVKVPELNNTTVKISTAKLQSLIENHASAIASAAKWSGLAIVEGTVLYLDSIKQTKYAEDLLNRFNKMN